MFSKWRISCMIFAVALSYYWINYIKRGPVYETNVTLKGKTVLITGGNAGVGKGIALEFAKKGARVIIASRNVAKSRATQKEIIEITNNPNIKVLQLDLADFDNVRKFVQDFIESNERLDYLINNAGASDVRGRFPSGLNKIFVINHFGHFLMTNLLLEKMKNQTKTRPLRIINMSSDAHKFLSFLGGADFIEDFMYYNPNTTMELLTAYSASKLANIYFSAELHDRYKDHAGITTYTIHPGAITSEIGKENSWPFRFFIQFFMNPLFFRSQFYGAQTTMYCSLDEDVVKLSGRYFSNCKEQELIDYAKNQTTQKIVWAKSVEITGL